jgi:hypothetical protein
MFWLQLLLGLGFLLMVGAGSVWHTVATFAREVSSLQVAQVARVNRARAMSSVFTLVGIIGAVMLAVDMTARVTNNVTLAAWGAAGAVLLTRGIQLLARLYARRHLERLAVPLLVMRWCSCHWSRRVKARHVRTRPKKPLSRWWTRVKKPGSSNRMNGQ